MKRNLAARAVQLFVLNLGLAGAALAGGAPKEVGIWYDDSGKGAVKVDVCDDNKLCGKIYWLKDKVNAEGKPLIDKHNPNESQRTRPICGMQVFGGLAKMDDGTWDSGWIYDPKEGKSYSVAMQLADQATLKVTGYLVMKMMGRTLTWTRAPADLPNCADNSAAAQGASKLGAASVPAAAKQAVTPPAPAAKAVTPAAATAPAKPAVSSKPALAKPAAAKPAADKPTAVKPAAAKAEKLPWADGGKAASTAQSKPAP